MSSKVIHKQAFFYTLINYIGTVIGIVSALFIYPLNFKFLGTVRVIDNIAQMLFPIMVLGASHALIKFYPALDLEKRRQLFNYSILSILSISFGLFLCVGLFTWLSDYDNKALLYFAFPMAVSLAFIELFRKQAQDMQKLALPTLYEKILPKIVLPLIFLLLLNHVLDIYPSLSLYVLCYVLIFLLTGIYLFRHFKPGFRYRFDSLFTSISRKDYFRYSLYSFAGSLGSLLAFRIDGIIIYEMISEEANGVFSNGVTLASTLQIPAVGLFALYAPMVSNYIKSENFTELKMKYREVARLLFLIGGLLYSCIVLGIEDLFRLLPAYEALKETLPVIYILGLSVLLNMATGFNTEIISYSKYYRFNMITIVSLIAVNISLNLLFIHWGYGIVGVAVASFISMGLFNLSKLLFIYKKFGMLPFDVAFVKLAVLLAVSGAIIFFLPNTDSHFINLIYKTGLSLSVNVFIVYKLKLVYQLNVWVNALATKFSR